MKRPRFDADPFAAAWLDHKREREERARKKAPEERGDPKSKSLAAKEEIRGPAMMRGLEYAFQMTGDPLFKDAQDAVRSYGLDQKLTQRGLDVYDKIMGATEIAWYRQMRHEIRHLMAKRRVIGPASEDGFIGEAAARVCATPRFPQGQSFEADVEKLRRGYSNWVSEGRPSELGSTLNGNLGRLVWVVPKNGKPLQIGSFNIPAEGAAKPDDLFLRRLLLEGAILVGRHEPSAG